MLEFLASIVFNNEIKSHIENQSKLPSDFWESFTNFKANYYHIKGNDFYIDMAKDYPNIQSIIDIIHNADEIILSNDEVNHTMYFNNLEDVKDLAEEIICFYSKNDLYVKYEIEKEFADTIATKQIVINDGGHLNSESGYTEFKELLEYI